MRLHTSSLLFMAAIPLLASAAPATVIKAGELKTKPFIDASVIGQVAAESEVDTLASDGAWVQVKTKDGKSGWLRMLNLRAKTAAGASGNSLQGIANLGNVARTGSTGTTATTGAKGISKEDLAQAAPNENEAKRLDGYRASADEAKRYAKTQKLAAHSIDIPNTAK